MRRTSVLSILFTSFALNIFNRVPSELAQRRLADRATHVTAADMQHHSLHFDSFPPTIQLIFVSTNIAKGKSEAPAKAADEKADKKPRKKKDSHSTNRLKVASHLQKQERSFKEAEITKQAGSRGDHQPNMYYHFAV